MQENSRYGIWIGENATVATTGKLMVAFLRLQKDRIVSILKHNCDGVIAVVVGLGVEWDGRCEVELRGVESRESADRHFISLHEQDRIVQDGGTLIYEMYDGKRFNCVLAEEIQISDEMVIPDRNPHLSVAERLELWNLGVFFELKDDSVVTVINTRRYSVQYSLDLNTNFIYCRVGQNGYCEKGYAMLAPICLRAHLVHMIEDNLASLNEYRPMLQCFASDRCAFPPDGGWYWSVKEITDDYISLHGCEGQTYTICRVKEREWVYEAIV